MVGEEASGSSGVEVGGVVSDGNGGGEKNVEGRRWNEDPVQAGGPGVRRAGVC